MKKWVLLLIAIVSLFVFYRLVIKSLLNRMIINLLLIRSQKKIQEPEIRPGARKRRGKGIRKCRFSTGSCFKDRERAM